MYTRSAQRLVLPDNNIETMILPHNLKYRGKEKTMKLNDVMKVRIKFDKFDFGMIYFQFKVRFCVGSHISLIIQMKNDALNRIFHHGNWFICDNEWWIEHKMLWAKKKYHVSVFLFQKYRFHSLFVVFQIDIQMKQYQRLGKGYCVSNCPRFKAYTICFKRNHMNFCRFWLRFQKNSFIHWLPFLINDSLHGYSFAIFCPLPP